MNPIEKDILECADILRQLENGDTSVRARVDQSSEAVIQLGKQINQCVTVYQESIDQSLELSMAIAEFLNILGQVTAGDYSARASTSFTTDALAALGKSINTTIAKIEERNLLVDSLMKELSTPVLHTWEGVIVMPLIGTMTSNRAQDAMERLLNSITKYQAKVAIIDITGVPVIDTMVAQHLIKTAKAVKILGGDAIITGISAEVASILVKIGIEVEQFITRNSLREGLQHAIKMIEAKK